MDVEALHGLAGLLRSRNALDAQIARLIGRPALPGHLGEWIAAEIFDIALADSAVTKGLDGHFRGTPDPGASVNVKLYGTRAGAVDLVEAAAADYYLVMTGPIAQPVSSRGSHRPVCVHGVYLFRTSELLLDLRERGVRIGVASSVRKELWEQAEVFPDSANPTLVLTEEQRYALSLFRDHTEAEREAQPRVLKATDSRNGIDKRRASARAALEGALRERGFAVKDVSRGRSIIYEAGRGQETVEVFLQTSTGAGPAYWKKTILTPAPGRYAALALFDPQQAEPSLYVIPSEDWLNPDGVLVDRTYETSASTPEWGVNLPGARAALESYAIDRVFPA